MTNEQVEHIAERVAEIAKKHPYENLKILVIPPPTAASGHLKFMFAVENTPLLSGSDDEPKVIVRIT